MVAVRGDGERGGRGGGRGFGAVGSGQRRVSKEVGDLLLEVCQLSRLDSESVLQYHHLLQS